MIHNPARFNTAQLIVASVVSPSIGSALAFGLNIWSLGNKKAAVGLFFGSIVWTAIILALGEFVPDEGLIFITLAGIIPTMGIGFLIEGRLDETLTRDDSMLKRGWLSLAALSCIGLILVLMISTVVSWSIHA